MRGPTFPRSEIAGTLSALAHPCTAPATLQSDGGIGIRRSQHDPQQKRGQDLDKQRCVVLRHFVWRQRQTDPTGKSLPIFGSRVKPRNQKYSAFVPGQIIGLNPPVSPGKRGVAHVTKRAVGCGGRGCADDERRGSVR
jgi:hypothetical protein